jgi:hypothetical protein
MEYPGILCKCGCTEFVSEPNRYDVYTALNGSLVLKESPFINDVIRLFCRECGLELNEVSKLLDK